MTIAAGQSFLARSYNASQVGVYPGSPWSSPVNASTPAGDPDGQFINVSVRTQVGGGAVLTQGFVVTGSAGSTEQVLVRGVGPALSQFDVTGALAQPTLSVFGPGGTLIASNTGWSTNANAGAIADAAAAVGAFALPQGSADSALLLTLSPGSYTLQVAGLECPSATSWVRPMGSRASTQIGNVLGLTQMGEAAGTFSAGSIISAARPRCWCAAMVQRSPIFAAPGILPQPALQLFDGNIT